MAGALGLLINSPSARCALSLLGHPRGVLPGTLASLRLEGGDARSAWLAGRLALPLGRAEPNGWPSPPPRPMLPLAAALGMQPEQAPHRSVSEAIK